MKAGFVRSAALLLFALAPCLVDAKVEKVKVGVSPTTSTAGIFIALEKGYFREESIEAELQIFPSSTAPMIPLLAKGELDVGGGNIAAGLFAADQENLGVALVADKGSVRKDADYLKLMVRSDLVKSGRFKEMKDLKGLRFGVTALGGTSQEAAAARFLKQGGLKTSDVQLVKVGYAEANKAFESKSLDAFIQLEPYVSEAVKTGSAKIVAGLYSIHPGQQSAAIFYSPVFATKREDVAIRFMKAYIRACRDYNTAFGPVRDEKAFSEIVAILTKWTNVKDPAIYREMVPAGLDPNGRLNVASLKEDVQYFKEQGYLKASPNWSRIVNTSFADRALKSLTPGNTKK